MTKVVIVESPTKAKSIKEMSEMLHMSESSYSDIETGKNNCGTLTTVLLLSIQEDPTHFLSTVNVEFQKWYAKEMMPV